MSPPPPFLVPRIDGSLLYPATPSAPPSLRPIDSEGTFTRWTSGWQNERRKGTVESISPSLLLFKTSTSGSRKQIKILTICRKFNKWTSSQCLFTSKDKHQRQLKVKSFGLSASWVFLSFTGRAVWQTGGNYIISGLLWFQATVLRLFYTILSEVL